MRMIHELDRILEELPSDATMDDSVSLALVNRLKARIARRESRFKTRAVETYADTQSDPTLMPAA